MIKFTVFASMFALAACAHQQKSAEAWPLHERCDLVATVLTYEAPGSESAVESSAFAAARDRDSSLRVFATTSESGRSLFADGESCGPRIKLADVHDTHDAAVLSLMPKSTRVFTFELQPHASAHPHVQGLVRQDAHGQWIIDAPKKTRALDAAPRRSSGNEKIQVGKITAHLSFDTGGDVMASSKQAGLVLVVRYEDQLVQQTIASCDEPAKGNALPPASPTAIDTAYCGDAFGIEFEPGFVSVQRYAKGRATEVTRVAVPKDLVIR